MDEEYKFNNSELENLWYIFVALSDITFSKPEVSLGKQGRYALSCEIMMSAMNTITSIDFCMNRSAYTDAYTLVRKLRDDLMQFIKEHCTGLRDTETMTAENHPDLPI